MTSRWSRTNAQRGAEYDRRWDAIAAAGQNLHGEADLVMAYGPRAVLDAGCGTGRVAIELANRGVDVIGVDLDSRMLDRARERSPELDWRHGDLSELHMTGQEFDAVVAAGNVMIFLDPGTESQAIERMAAVLGSGGRLIVGFELRSDQLTIGDYDAMAAAVGLDLEDRYSTWQCEVFGLGCDYAVSVHRRS